MKQVYYVPMSSRERHIEDSINEAIGTFERAYKVEWLTNLIKAPDDNKFMLVFEREDGAGSNSPAIGVKVIQGSQNKLTTEDMLNNAFKELELDEDKNFISLFHPAEFVYIILYENKAGKFPRVKIIPNPVDPNNGARQITTLLNILDEDENWGLQPYDSFMLDKTNMIMLFTEE
jgi:hypothetical protein